MGGAAAGEIASSLAVDEVLRLTEGAGHGVECAALMERAIAAANEAIYTRSQRNQRLSGMGTTMVALAVRDAHAWVMNIGDSRCYLFRNGKLEQITADHSLVEEQVRSGRMTQAEAQRSPLKNVITRALGTQSQVTPDVFALETEPGDLFLLCTDGLTRELTDAAIEDILRKGISLTERCASLVEAANRVGGHDNVTCLLVSAAR
jgi:protein phosphatase